MQRHIDESRSSLRLTADALACRRGGREVFSGVSFAVSSGEALMVTGANGSGKSSLLRMLAGLLRPAAGELVLAGGERLPEQSHFLGHQDALKPSLTVGENLAFWISYFGGGSADALGRVGLDDLADLPAGILSAGQRRRLSLARLVAVPRPVWLLDEPSSSLDARGQSLLAKLMRDHLAGGGIVVAAAHGPIGLERARELPMGRFT